MEPDSTTITTGSEQASGTAATTALTPASSVEIPKTKDSHLATAVAVKDEKVVVADPVEEQQEDETGNQQPPRCIGMIALAVLVAIVIGLSVGLRQKGTNMETSTASGDDSMVSSNEDDSTEVPQDYQQRREDVIALLEPLYEDIEGGVNVFETSSSFGSDDRIAALEWLVQEDKVPIPTLPGNTSLQDEMDSIVVDYEQQIYKLRQRYVLALLYMATNGEGWHNQYNFLSAFDECLWTSIYDSDTDTIYIEDEFNIKGAVCNDKGQIEKLAMWWNGMSGTLPHELSLFSDTLKELNLAGGSLSGTIPDSLTKLTNMQLMSVSDNCFTGDLPEAINPIDMPNLGILAIQMNNYELNPVSLAGYCDGQGSRIEGVIALAADCPADEFLDNDDGNLTLAETAPYGCDCCICCYPESFECQDLASGASWAVHFLAELSPNGYPKGFDTQCVSNEQQGWIAENCPCLINITNEPITQPFLGQCTTDCSLDGAIPSYDFGA